MNRNHGANREPEWNFWNAYDVLGVFEALSLSVGFNPDLLQLRESMPIPEDPVLSNDYLRRLEVAKRAALLPKCPYEIIQIKHISEEDIRIRVEPASFRKFLQDRGFRVDPRWAPARPAATTWPWGTHETQLLQHLDAAARKWWTNYDPTDPSTAPTNAQVTSWLETQRSCSQTSAKAIATILRADGIRKGPRRLKG